MFGKNKLKIQRIDNQYWLCHKKQKIQQIGEAHIEYIQKELDHWWLQLNTVLGVLSFTLAIAVQGTPNPPLNAFLSLAFFFAVHITMVVRYFPSSVKTLRQNKKESQIAEALLRYVEPNLMGWKTILSKSLTFFMGYVYLILMVALAFPFVQKLKPPLFDSTLAQIFLPSSCVCLAP